MSISKKDEIVGDVSSVSAFTAPEKTDLEASTANPIQSGISLIPKFCRHLPSYLKSGSAVSSVQDNFDTDLPNASPCPPFITADERFEPAGLVDDVEWVFRLDDPRGKYSITLTSPCRNDNDQILVKKRKEVFEVTTNRMCL